MTGQKSSWKLPGHGAISKRTLTGSILDLPARSSPARIKTSGRKNTVTGHGARLKRSRSFSSLLNSASATASLRSHLLQAAVHSRTLLLVQWTLLLKSAIPTATPLLPRPPSGTQACDDPRRNTIPDRLCCVISSGLNRLYDVARTKISVRLHDRLLSMCRYSTTVVVASIRLIIDLLLRASRQSDVWFFPMRPCNTLRPPSYFITVLYSHLDIQPHQHSTLSRNERLEHIVSLSCFAYDD